MRDAKGKTVDFMRLSLVKYDVFAGCGGIAEAIADVEAENLTVYKTLCRAPVPCVFICPYASSPVKQTEAVIGGEDIVSSVKANLALGSHADYLLVIIESGFLFGERGSNDH